MSYSIQRAVSDGTLDYLDISIEYFDREEISVLFDGVVDARQWAWVGVEDKAISFTPAVVNGIEVTVRRTTDISQPRHEYSGGAMFTTEALDESLRQVLHIAQEAKEGSGLGEVYQDLNFHGFKAVNVGDGSAPMDAVNHRQMEVHDATIVGYMNAADASADAAAASAAAAAVSEANAATAVAAGISAHVAAADPHTQYIKESDIGVTVEGVDPTLVRTNTSQQFTGAPRTDPLTDNDGTFDLSAKMDFVCTPTGGITLTFSNVAAGKKGQILFINTANYAVAKAANVKADSQFLTKASATGRYRISYSCLDGTNVDVTISGALS